MTSVVGRLRSRTLTTPPNTEATQPIWVASLAALVIVGSDLS